MSSDIRNFFTKKKIKVRYESNSLSEKRKQRKAKLEKGPRQATIESLGRVIVIEGKGWALWGVKLLELGRDKSVW